MDNKNNASQINALNRFGTQRNPIDFLKNIEKETFIDVEHYIAVKSMLLLWGRGDKIVSDKPKIKDALLEFYKDNNLHIQLPTASYLLSIVGRLIWTLDKPEGADKLYLTFAALDWSNKITRYFDQQGNAVIHKFPLKDDKGWVVRELWTPKKVVRTLYYNNEQIRADENLIEIPKELRMQKDWEHNLGIMPLGELLNKKINLYAFLNPIHNQNEFIRLADNYAGRNMPYSINNLMRNKFKEAILNKTKIIGNFTPAEWESIKSQNSEIASLIGEFIIKTQNLGKDGQAAKIETMQGNPQFASYDNSIDFEMGLVCNLAGYSYNAKDAMGDSATFTLYANSLDFLTTKHKRDWMQEQVMQMFDKVLVAKGLLNAEDLNKERDYQYIINENNIVSERESIELGATLKNEGLATLREVIAKIRNIDNDEQLDEIVKEIKDDQRMQMQEQQEIINTMEGNDELDGKPSTAIDSKPNGGA